MSVDKSLMLAEKRGAPALAPQEIYYQLNTSSGSTEQSTSFTIKTPGRGWLLSTEVWLEYTVRLAGAALANVKDMFEGANSSVPASNTKYFPRANSPLSRIISNCQVTVNGTTINDRPSSIQDAMDRLYLSEDESKSMCTTSAGYFDGPYQHYPQLDCSVPSQVITFNTNSGTIKSANNQSNGMILLAGNNNGGANSYARVGLSKGLAVGTGFRRDDGQAPGDIQNAAAGNTIFVSGGEADYYNEGATERWKKFVKRAKGPGHQFGAGAEYAGAVQNLVIVHRI